jgi:hypothetical protein
MTVRNIRILKQSNYLTFMNSLVKRLAILKHHLTRRSINNNNKMLRDVTPSRQQLIKSRFSNKITWTQKLCFPCNSGMTSNKATCIVYGNVENHIRYAFSKIRAKEVESPPERRVKNKGYYIGEQRIFNKCDDVTPTTFHWKTSKRTQNANSSYKWDVSSLNEKPTNRSV